MKIQEIKSVINLCKDLSIDFKEVVINIEKSVSDFEVDNYRFISESEIDEIQCNELSSDSYTLGCFKADFIANNTNLSYEIVKALQEADKYDAIGNYIIANEYVSAIQSEYARLDGYGSHFASYDGDTGEELLHLGYYYFRVN